MHTSLSMRLIFLNSSASLIGVVGNRKYNIYMLKVNILPLLRDLLLSSLFSDCRKYAKMTILFYTNNIRF
jgi:hypothetical protein